MATLTVWRFPTATGADEALDTLQKLQRQELIKVQDGAVVSWPDGARKPRTRHLGDMVGMGAVGGAFWGFILGLIFFVPLLGAALGAAGGALGGHLAHVGIDDDFVRQVREKVTPGTSALFVLSSDAVVDRVRTEFDGRQAELLETNLSAEEEARLREAFTEGE
ncbi:DUF1269 domain-containing protein [Kitasatospora purpeofusca]|uniref:DUF1269 domain-containing protein n=1 Tax=Kitasatospora purpeofusca TaxID=67352 RepID=UPI00224ED249|nr:DUF1269 domain-containing protein [Kitasatospora purpeofusca]MCX4755345.1 DUF1269 domain-containing protein [Kitasatospora purpeofusca]WSR36780.1 DUF1269 domain-containing protein [Kitasatospora purpeofusca]